jgi:cbb3-type cytochrome oxidase maturation protein
MSVIVLLIVAGGLVAGGFLAAFIWAVRSGQFDDTFTPAVRVLLEAPASGCGMRRSANREPRGTMTDSEDPDGQRSP